MNGSTQQTTVSSSPSAGGASVAPEPVRIIPVVTHERILQRTGRIVERSKQVSVLYAIASSVSQSLDFQQTLNRAVELVPRLMGFEAGLILLTDKTSDALTLKARFGFSDEAGSLIQSLNPKEQFIGPSVITGEPLIGEIPRQSHDLLATHLRERGFWFFVTIPLRSKGSTLGVMVLVSHGPRHVDPESSQFLLSMGDVIGVAIENASLYHDVANLLEETQRQANRLQESERQSRAIAELGQQALAGVDLSTLMNEATTLIAKTLDVEYSGVLELMENKETLLIRASAGPLAQMITQTMIPVDRSQAGYALRTNRPVIVENLATDPRFTQRTRLHELGVVSGMSVVIPGHHQPFGVLFAHTTNRRTFTKDDTNFLQNIAHILAEAIERKRTEEALEAEKQRLSITLRSIGDGVITTDTQGCVVLINKVAEMLTGWTQQEAVGQPLSAILRLLDEKTHELYGNPATQVLQTGTRVTQTEPITMVARDQTRYIITYESNPIVERDGKIVGTVLVFRDITEKQQMEYERLKAQKLESIGLLAGGIAHDFNNLLMAIMGNISLAKIEAEGDEKLVDRLTAAERACLQSKNLTHQLLTFSKGGAPIKKTTSMVGLIKDTAEFALRGSNVRCQFVIADSLWHVEADEGQISQVIQNLIINAMQAMPDGGTITVSAENVHLEPNTTLPLPGGRYVKVVVKDHGVGIPPENITKIFDPYFTTKKKGSGLGLAAAYSIVKKHDGFISVESEVGVGSTFTVYLPATTKSVISAKPPLVASAQAQGSGRILVMDDEQIIRDVTGHILRRLGYEAAFAQDGEEAITAYQQAMAENRPFQAVIMDLTIPGGMGGKEAIKRLREIDPNVKAIVSSGYSNDPVMSNFTEYGFSGCVAKPYNVQELSHTLQKVISGN